MNYNNIEMVFKDCYKAMIKSAQNDTNDCNESERRQDKIPDSSGITQPCKGFKLI